LNRENKIKSTITHEIIEAELMKTGLPYHIAHMYAIEYEKGVYRTNPIARVLFPCGHLVHRLQRS
jgi:hypothetical protein